jgi:hypothetical protein
LDLLAVNKQIYHEAAELVYRTAIFAFREVDAFREFAAKNEELAARVQNLVLYIEPRGERMHLWNEWLCQHADFDLNSKPDPNYDEGLLSVFTDVQRLQIVVGNTKAKVLDEHCLWTVYGLLVLSKLPVPEVSVNVSLCSGNPDGADRFARALEGKLQRPWDGEAERELRESEAEYASSPVAMVNIFMVEGSRCVFPG